MTGRELIAELLKHDIDKDIKLYSLVDMENVNTELSEFEFIGDNIKVVEDTDNIIYIEGEY